MSLTLYQGTTSPGTAIVLYQVDKYYAYIRFDNNTPNHLSINFGGTIVDVGEFYSQDVQPPKGFQGTIVVTPSAVITSVSHGQANNLVIKGQYAQEVTSLVSQAIPQQAVTTTATGKPIFSATIGFGATATIGQDLNIFNPANSGIVAEFHAARAYTNDGTGPTANLFKLVGADQNFATAVPAVFHGSAINPVSSVMHCTAVDSATTFPATSNPETMNMQQNVTQDMLAFPDNIKLYPGENLYLEMSSGSTGHVVRLTLKWTEDTIVPPILVTGATAVATQIDNSILSPLAPVGTNLIKSVVPGPLTPVQIFDDGTGFYAVDQSGTLHRVFTFNASGNPLQLGQAGDTLETLGALTIDQFLTAVQGLIANGQVTATAGIRTQGSTSPAVDLSGSSGAIALKLFAGTISRVSVFTGSASTAGQLVAHGLGIKPDWVGFTENDTVGDSNNFAWDTAASDATNVKVWGNNATARSFTALAIKL